MVGPNSRAAHQTDLVLKHKATPCEALADALGIAESLKRDGNLPDNRKGLLNKIHDALSPETRADVYYEIKEYDSAIADYTQVITLDRKKVTAYQGRAKAYFAKAAYDNAIADYTRVIALDSSDGMAYRERAKAYFEKREFDKAIADYNELIKGAPISFWACRDYSERGKAWMAKGDYDRAIADYDEAIQLDSKFAPPYNNRGVVWFNRGDYDRATADYDEAIWLDPKAWAYTNRGTAWYYKGDYNRAIVDYDEAIKLDPKFTQAYRLRAVSNLYSGLLPEALADLDRASKMEPKNPYTALWLRIVDKRINFESRLPQVITQIDMTEWPAPVIQLFLGQLTPADVLAAAAAPDAIKMKGQICEANFFNGERALERSEREEAARLFQLAAAECPKGFFEWASANAELKALGMKP